MKKKLFLAAVLTGLLLLLAACGEDEIEPVAIDEATDTCEVCNMAVVDNEFATQLALENGRSIVFDDIGCMYDWKETNGTEEVLAEFVRDYNTQEWIDVEDATFLYNESVKTPMAYNVISFTDNESAKEFSEANEGSTIMTASELADHSWERNHDMMGEHGMEHHSHDEDGDMTEDSHDHDHSHEDEEEHHE